MSVFTLAASGSKNGVIEPEQDSIVPVYDKVTFDKRKVLLTCKTNKLVTLFPFTFLSYSHAQPAHDLTGSWLLFKSGQVKFWLACRVLSLFKVKILTSLTLT